MLNQTLLQLQLKDIQKSIFHMELNFKKILEKLGFQDLVDEMRLLTYNKDYEGMKNLNFE